MKLQKTKVVKQTLDIINELSSLDNIKYKMNNLDRISISELKVFSEYLQELLEYRTGIIRNDDIIDKLLDDIIKVSKHAFTYSEPGIHRDIKIKCQKILDLIG